MAESGGATAGRPAHAPRKGTSHAAASRTACPPVRGRARMLGPGVLLVLGACGDATGPALGVGDRCGPDRGAVLTLADPALEGEVRAALGLGRAESLTCGRAASLRSLGANGAGIRHLTGIENLTGLTELLLARNAIEDLGPLASLTGLRYLDVRENAVTDLGPLAGLTAMVALSVGHNLLSDLAPLRSMTALQQLGASHNRITDLSPLSEFEGLLRLELYNNEITDLSPIAGMWTLQTLDVGRNTVPDLSPLAGLDNLLIIGLERTTVTDLRPLGDMLHLSFLVLDDNRELSDIQPLLDNPGVGRNDRVWLERTAVSCEDVALLEAKRATVTSSCP